MSPEEKRAVERSNTEAKAAEVNRKKEQRASDAQAKRDADAEARAERIASRRETQDRADARHERLMQSRAADRKLKREDQARKAAESKERSAARQAETQRKIDKAKEKAENDKVAQQNREKNAEVKKRSDLTKKDVNRLRSIKVGFDNVQSTDGTATAVSKFGGNVATAAGAAAKAGALGARALYRKGREVLAKNKRGDYDKKKQFVKGLLKRNPRQKVEGPSKQKTEPVQKIKTDQNVPAQKALPPARSQKALPPARSQKALPPGREQKALPAGRTKALPAGRTKALPAAKEKGTYVGKKYTITQGSDRGGSLAKRPTGGAGSLTRAVDTANNKRAAKRAQTTSSGDYASKADRIAAFKKRRDADKAAGVKMREEYLQEVEKMKKEKVDKVINIMRGKNKIETMPKSMGESKHWKDDYKPLEFETIDLIKPEPLKVSDWRKEIDESSAAWTRKAGKKKSGGLNEKGRKSYERENPGSDLKAPSKKVGNPRRKSFCARMKGMKKKLTSSKTANDPNSRINKSLRAWNC